MKRQLVLLSLTSALLMSCANSVVPVAAVTFKTVGEQVVWYSADVSFAYPHIYLYENEAARPNPADPKYVDNGIGYRLDCEQASLLYISFNKNMGKDEIYDTTVMYVEVKYTPYMSAVIKNEYGEGKDLYLNGVKLVADTTTPLTGSYELMFNKISLKRTNPNGTIQNIINTLELK